MLRNFLFRMQGRGKVLLPPTVWKKNFPYPFHVYFSGKGRDFISDTESRKTFLSLNLSKGNIFLCPSHNFFLLFRKVSRLFFFLLRKGLKFYCRQKGREKKKFPSSQPLGRKYFFSFLSWKLFFREGSRSFFENKWGREKSSLIPGVEPFLSFSRAYQGGT